METTNFIHLGIDQLQALASGGLDPKVAGPIETHLLHCPFCCGVIEVIPGGEDCLVRIRAARPEPVAASSDLDVPTVLRDHSRYRVVGRLGGGGMGTIFLAEHRLLERPVVIKVIHPDLVGDPELRERFERESRLAAKFSHPNIVTVHEAEQIGETYLLVMEYLDGEDLASLVRKRGSLPVAVACELIRQAAVGLQHLHEHDLVHRDIKPANLMLTVGGRLKVLDLGLAFLKTAAPQDQGLTRPQQSMGTVDYMAPEQWEDCHEVDTRADIYSLGCSLYCLLSGKPPFGTAAPLNLMRQIWSHSLVPPPPIRVKRPDVPEGLAAVVNRMLAKQPTARFSVPGEVAAALTPFAAGCDLLGFIRGDEGLSVLAPLATVVDHPRAGEPWSRRAWLTAAVGLPALAASGVGFYAGRPTRSIQSAAAHTPLGEPPVRVGILHSLTGSMSISEKPVIDATVQAIDEINRAGGVLGRRVEAIVADGASDPATFARLAEKLIAEDRVCTLFGCWTSASRKMVKPIVERLGGLLFYPVQYEGLEESSHIVYTGAAPNQQILPAVKWCCSFLGKKRLFLVGSDYIFPHCAHAIIRDQADALGGEVVGEEYLSLGAQDAATVVRKIVEARPDVILNSINGDTNIPFFKALRDAGITSEAVPTVSFSITEEELNHLDGRMVAGDFAAWNYFMTVDRPRNPSSWNASRPGSGSTGW